MSDSTSEAGSSPNPDEQKKSAKAWTYVDQRIQNALPPEDFRVVADVRRQMWTGGFYGCGAGLCAGLLSFIFTRRVLKPKWLVARNHLPLFTLVGGAAGGYAGTTSAGHVAVRQLDEVLEKHNTRSAPESYRSRMQDARAAAAREEEAAAERLRAALAAKAAGSTEVLSDGIQYERADAPIPKASGRSGGSLR